MASGSAARIRRSGGSSEAPGSGTNGARAQENDFLKYISIDLSSLERRFDEVFLKLAALEMRVDNIDGANATGDRMHPDTVLPPRAAVPSPETEDASAHAPESSDGTSGASTSTTNATATNTASAPPSPDTASESKLVDLSGLAKEIESLRAAQLRLKIDHELSQSTLKLELETMRRDLELMPQQNDLASFRLEIDVLLAQSLKSIESTQAAREHAQSLALAEREVAANEWKAEFEATLGARIQDLWSGLHATARKLQESMQFLQTDLIKQEDATRESTDAMAQLTRKASALERDVHLHATTLADHVKGIEELFRMAATAETKLAAHEAGTASHVAGLTERLETTESRWLTAQRRHDAFTTDVETTLKNVCSDVVSCQSSLAAHQESLHSVDAGIQRQSAELMRMGDQLVRTDAKVGNIDGRVVVGEKKTAAIASVVQEHHQELQHHVSEMHTRLDQAGAERATMKRTSTDLHYALHETQQKLSEVAKMATTTDLALTRTAAEIPKLHVLVSTNAANIAKNRQTLRDVTTMVDEAKSERQAIERKLETEAAHTTARFTDVHARSDATDAAVQDAASTTQSIKHALEDAIRHNGNLIHQLNTMVDSIAITESADGMEDKLARFALSVAECALKLEHFASGSGSGGPSTTVGRVHADVHADLAVLLAKVTRFLGSGVSIDQNKYLLTVKRPHAVDPATGAVVVELPPQHVLDNFRVAKATLFTTRTRMLLDQLAPVLATNKHARAFRDNFARKLQFVLEFGLANLFPNAGRPKLALRKRDGALGTCIACDRPIDSDETPDHGNDDDDHHQPQRCRDGACDSRSCTSDATGPEHETTTAISTSASTVTSSFADDAIADEHRLRRQRLVTSAGAAPSQQQQHRIDTTSVVRGRSGNTGYRPKSSAEPVHHAPGAADFIYRAGFRLPKPATQSSSSSSALAPGAATTSGLKSASTAALLFTSAHGQQPASPHLARADDHGTDGSRDLLDDGSSLERVVLVGKHQQHAPVEIPLALETTAAVASLPRATGTARPHTAPFRTKSLPRLEGVAGGAPVAPVAATASGDLQRVVV